MKTQLKQINTKNFIINYPEELESFIHESLSIFDSKTNLIKDTFGKLTSKKIKASYFIDRKSFVDYIKKVSNGHEPPSWAIGCFYNHEIQTLLNINDLVNLNLQKHTLTHEFVHLCFDFYETLNIPRICWFDESYAGFIDGSEDNISLSLLIEKAKKLKQLGDFNVNTITDSSKFVTKEYNGYDMFLIIGKYIFDNHLEKQLLKTLKNDYRKIQELGNTILAKSIDYIESLEQNAYI